MINASENLFLLMLCVFLHIVGNPGTSVWNSAASASSASTHRSVLRQWRRCQRLVHFHGICAWG